VRRVGVLVRCGAAAALLSVPLAAVAQTTPDLAAQRAESLRLSGRPWHAAETLLAAAAREPRLNATFIVEGAKAELRARRYDRARSLLVGQPWLEDYADGEALAVLAEAEARLAVREGLAWEAVGERDSAAAAYAAARAAGLSSIDPWLRVRQARVTRDTAVAFRLLADLPPPVAREAGAARAQALLAAGDSAAALEALAQAGRSLDFARLARALGDSSRARDALYALMARAPETDDAAAAVGIALAGLTPRTPPEYVALARAMKPHGAASDARLEVERAIRLGDSSAATLVLAGELLAGAGRYRDAERAYRAAARDSALGALAIYRRARILARLGDAGAPEALSGFAQSFPADTAAPTALYVLGDMLADRGEWAGAARWFDELIARYPGGQRQRVVPSRGGGGGSAAHERALLARQARAPVGGQHGGACVVARARARGFDRLLRTAGPARGELAPAPVRGGAGARALGLDRRGARPRRHAAARWPRHGGPGRGAHHPRAGAAAGPGRAARVE